MLCIRNTADLASALSAPINPTLRSLLARRRSQLTGDGYPELGEIANFVVAEAGDTLPAVESHLGFSPLLNPVDQARFPEPDFTPFWEWIERHQGWFEMAFVMTDDGFGHVLFVQDEAGADPVLLQLCRTFVDAASGNRGRRL